MIHTDAEREARIRSADCDPPCAEELYRRMTRSTLGRGPIPSPRYLDLLEAAVAGANDTGRCTGRGPSHGRPVCVPDEERRALRRFLRRERRSQKPQPRPSAADDDDRRPSLMERMRRDVFPSQR